MNPHRDDVNICRLVKRLVRLKPYSEGLLEKGHPKTLGRHLWTGLYTYPPGGIAGESDTILAVAVFKSKEDVGWKILFQISNSFGDTACGRTILCADLYEEPEVVKVILRAEMIDCIQRGMNTPPQTGQRRLPF